MRIVLVEPDGAGGLLHYAHQLCEGLARAGGEVTLVTGRHFELADVPRSFTVDTRIRLWPAVGTTLPAGRLRGLVNRLGRKVRRVWRGLRYAWEWHRLTRHLLAIRPDVIQFSAIHFPFQAVFLRRLRRAGLTLTQICHEFEPRERGRLTAWVHHAGNRAVFACFERIYLHGETNRDRFHELFEVPRDRTRSIRHGNEDLLRRLGGASPERDPDPGRPPMALFFGGLRPSKGIEDLIDAWEFVRYEVEAELHVCGEPAGVDPAALQSRIEEAGVSVSVTLDPRYQPFERVAELMGRATLVVLPYRSATASGVLQVAYSFGRPVVATTVGTLVEDVVDGETGLLVPVGDRDALARALIKLLSDTAEATRMGRGAAAKSAEYDWAVVAAQVLEDYRGLAA